MKEYLQKKMLEYAETGNKEVFKDVASSVTDKCADIYYMNFHGMPDDLRKAISVYMLDMIFKRMVIPAIDEARKITRGDNIGMLEKYCDMELVNELVKRNGIGEAPTKTIRQGEWCEVLVQAGDDETVHITFPDEALEEICKSDKESLI